MQIICRMGHGEVLGRVRLQAREPALEELEEKFRQIVKGSVFQ